MKTSIYSILFLAVFILAGCKKSPEACFTQDKATAATGETITFTSCAENSETTEWTMGDGESKTGNSVTHSYSEPGVYLVTQRVESKNGRRSDQVSQLITVPEPPVHRYITQIRIIQFDSLKTTGATWDDVPGVTEPDVYLLFTIEGSNWELRTPVLENAKAVNLPIVFNYEPDNILLTNENWSVVLRDNDLFGASFDEMGNWVVNPATAGGNGVISIGTAGNKIEIHYVTR